MIFIFCIFFIVLCFGIFIRYKKYRQANQLFNRAKALERQSSADPCNTTKLREALTIYWQCSKIVNSSASKKAIERCSKKIEDCQRFKSLVIIGKNNAEKNYFKVALSNFKRAEKLFSTDRLIREIEQCHRGIERENKYEETLKRANQIAREGGFQSAIDLLLPAIENFVRQDGKELLNKLRLVIKTRDLYQLGLIAEREGKIDKAIALYQQALNLIPEYIDCKLRLAIVVVKNNPLQAIDYLKQINTKQAKYIRGFAYIQLKSWQEAKRQWSAINDVNVEAQKNQIEDLISRERLSVVSEIKKRIDLKELEKAKSISIDFLIKHNNNLEVRQNLEKHIYPAIEHRVWKNKNKQEIVAHTQKAWLEQQDIKSLHNWAIATYYWSQFNPDKLTDFVMAWSTALANINLDPSIKNIPWLDSDAIDLKDTLERLKQVVESAIDAVKDSNIEEYLKLRDIYRQDMLLLNLSQQNNCGIKTSSQLLILPNYYRHFKKYLPQTRLPTKLWGALYTDWGTAVAACHEGDIDRAIKIKPKQEAISQVDNFARALVCYHEGYHYLKNQSWRKAIGVWQDAKAEIVIQPDWCIKIDRLCEIQRQQIEDFQEHLEFSRLWYLLIGSQASKTYYVEYQSMQVGLDVDDNKIDFDRALNKLKELQYLDPDNIVASNIIETLEINLALEKINYFWQKSQYEHAVRVAKKSRHEKVRFAVAEVCLEIVLEILQSGDITPESIQSIQKITQWAYELCPTEPQFQTAYSQLKQLGIHC